MSPRLVLLLATASLGLAPGCRSAPAPIQELTVGQAHADFLSGAVFLDVNNPDFRARYGKVPGALLLTSSGEFGLAELPKDKDVRLVAYCSSRL
jgi:hypothetical protein